MFCLFLFLFCLYSKTCLKRPLSKRQKKWFKRRSKVLQNASAILSNFINLPLVIKIFILSILHMFYCMCLSFLSMGSHHIAFCNDTCYPQNGMCVDTDENMRYYKSQYFKKKVSMSRKYHNHTLQTNPRHHEERKGNGLIISEKIMVIRITKEFVNEMQQLYIIAYQWKKTKNRPRRHMASKQRRFNADATP